jgi:hypothetical protein
MVPTEPEPLVVLKLDSQGKQLKLTQLEERMESELDRIPYLYTHLDHHIPKKFILEGYEDFLILLILTVGLNLILDATSLLKRH